MHNNINYNNNNNNGINKQYDSGAGLADTNDRTYYHTSHITPAADRFNNLYKNSHVADAMNVSSYNSNGEHWNKLNVTEKTQAVYEKCKMSRTHRQLPHYNSRYDNGYLGTAPSPYFSCEDILKISSRSSPHNALLSGSADTCYTSKYGNAGQYLSKRRTTTIVAGNNVDTAIV